MIADVSVLELPKIALHAKQLLPEYSGIYYVLDETQTIWYIGKAQNLRKRWQGKSHHRIYQLEAQKKKYFTIYYEQVDDSQLDHIEKQRISQYNPYLNATSVKTKTLRPTETLLRETIAAIADFAVILGIEPPRKEIESQMRSQWLGQKKVLGLNVIHIALNDDDFQEKFKPESLEEEEALIKKPFMSRKAYAHKWESVQFARQYRLSVNNYAIEINSLTWFLTQEIRELKQYKQTTLAQESIRTLTPEALTKIQHQADNQQSYALHLQRLIPYTSDLIQLLFNEPIDHEGASKELTQISEDYKTGKRGVGSRSTPIKSKFITSEFTTIDELLLSRGIEPNKYDQGQIITFPKFRDRIGVYIKTFSGNGQQPYYNLVEGMLDNKTTKGAYSQFNLVYLLANVDTKAWLLVEEYLKDFALPAGKLSNGEGFMTKFYISPRKYIVPAKVNIKLEKIEYSAWIPFGFNPEFPSLELAIEEIRKRVQNSDLPDLKVSFKRETIEK